MTKTETQDTIAVQLLGAMARAERPTVERSTQRRYQVFVAASGVHEVAANSVLDAINQALVLDKQTYRECLERTLENSHDLDQRGKEHTRNHCLAKRATPEIRYIRRIAPNPKTAFAKEPRP